jgi:hypothetical protein
MVRYAENLFVPHVQTRSRCSGMYHKHHAEQEEGRRRASVVEDVRGEELIFRLSHLRTITLG